MTSPSLVVVAGLNFFFSNFLLLFPADLTFHAQGQITCQRLPTDAAAAIGSGWALSGEIPTSFPEAGAEP